MGRSLILLERYVGMDTAGNLVVWYKVMTQSECGRTKMAGSVVAMCLLLLVAPTCRGGLPQEKYTTRSALQICTS